MARSKTDIKKEITKTFMANQTLASAYGYEVNDLFEAQFSLLSLENILFEIISFSIFLLELLFDQHKKEVEDILYNQVATRAPWYRFKALAFQYGYDLVQDTDRYDNTGISQDEIELSKIIRYAAVVESEDESRVIVKIAGEEENVLAPIGAQPFEAVVAYFKEIRAAGVKVTIINYLPDELYVNLVIYRDPLVLNDQGQSILEGTYPVTDAIDAHLKQLPFNGEFIMQDFVDALQIVEGVRIAHLVSASTAFIDPAVNAYGTPIPINVKTIPESGYFKLIPFDDTANEPSSSISYVV